MYLDLCSKVRILTILDADLAKKPFFPGLIECKLFSGHATVDKDIYANVLFRHAFWSHLRHDLGGTRCCEDWPR